MNACDKIKLMILAKAVEIDKFPVKFASISEAELRDEWDRFCEWKDEHGSDAEEEIRCGGVSTGRPPKQWSRHYETKEVATQFQDGTWVAWTYYYGGGKHGEPSAVDWMDDAYDLECIEEEKMVVVRTFSEPSK